MATNEEYLDNLLKAFEEEEKAREKEIHIPQEKTIITDNDDMKSLLEEVDLEINLDDTASASEDMIDLMSMLSAELPTEEVPVEEVSVEDAFAEEVPSDDIADLMSMLGAELPTEEVPVEEVSVEDAFAEEVPSDDIADLMSMLGAELSSEEMPVEEVSAEEAPAEETPSDDIAALMSMLEAENALENKEDNADALFNSDSGNEWTSDLDALLASAIDNLDENQDFFNEAGAESALSEDMDITQLIDGMGEADESLSEISELLKKSDNNEMLDSFTEPEDNEAIKELTKDNSTKKKGSRLRKKGRKEKTEKEAGAFGQFFKALLEDEEDEGQGSEASSTDGVPADENDDLLKQLEEENSKGKKKKEKKEKKKKDKKAKKDGANQEEGADENLDGEEDGKGKKKKKREKKQKEKAEKIAEPKEKSKKVLPRKAFMVLIAFCASLIAIIVCLSAFLPDYIEKKQARDAFYQGNYEDAYVLLYGKNLNDSDRLILNRVSVVLQLERKLEAYYFNDEAGEAAEALDSLMQGVSYYQELTDKNIYGAGDELRLVYQKILDVLSQKYGVDEGKVLEVIAGDDIRYSQWIYSVAEGMEFGEAENVVTQPEPEPEGPQDILPEEEAIINTESAN